MKGLGVVIRYLHWSLNFVNRSHRYSVEYKYNAGRRFHIWKTLQTLATHLVEHLDSVLHVAVKCKLNFIFKL